MATPRTITKAAPAIQRKPKLPKAQVLARASEPRPMVKARKASVDVKSELAPAKKMPAAKTPARVSRGASGRLYGGESAPKYSPLGTKHYVNDDDYGVGNRMYGQDRPKKSPTRRSGGR